MSVAVLNTWTVCMASKSVRRALIVDIAPGRQFGIYIYRCSETGRASTTPTRRSGPRPRWKPNQGLRSLQDVTLACPLPSNARVHHTLQKPPPPSCSPTRDADKYCLSVSMLHEPPLGPSKSPSRFRVAIHVHFLSTAPLILPISFHNSSRICRFWPYKFFDRTTAFNMMFSVYQVYYYLFLQDKLFVIVLGVTYSCCYVSPTWVPLVGDSTMGRNER